MKKRLTLLVLVLAAVITGALSFSACNTQGDDGETDRIKLVYNGYVAYAAENGQTPLSYEEWLESVKGKDGSTPTITVSGEYWVINGEMTAFKALGEKGDKGEDGLSAFEIYKKYHPDYLGTEREWIESYLKGELPATVDDTDGLGFYPLPDGTYAVSAGNTVYLEDILIPATHKGKAVSSIAEEAFVNAKLKSISIPDSVTNIGGGAFSGCTGLTEIDIPDSVTNIGGDAFYGCSNLTNIILGGGVESIGGYAFYNCTGLTEIDIPDSVKSIGGSVFSGCSNLTNIILGDGVESIGGYAFYNCTGLTEIDIPDSVKSIGGSVFSGCSNLTNIILGDGVTSIEGVFDGARQLTTVTLGSGVTSIGDKDFRNFRNLTAITLGSGVKSIGDWAFEGCSSLTDVYYDGDVKGWCEIESDCIYLFIYAENLYIKENGEYKPVKDLVIPEGVTIIQNNVFSGYRGLTSVTIPSSVTSIGYRAFSYCQNLTSITVDKNNQNYCSINGDLYSKDGKTIYAYACGKKAESFEIPVGVENIEVCAFGGCINLKNVIIPNGVKCIGNCAFEDCGGLISVTIPASVASIGSYAFFRNSCDQYPDEMYYQGFCEHLIVNFENTSGWIDNDGESVSASDLSNYIISGRPLKRQ